ncbi:DNA polymerase III subunit chi [Actinobacillus equuli]|nr:DNA polymerase III subunit chi [Actinobacillus equuli]
MKQVKFYLLSQASSENLSAAEAMACELSAQAWKLGKRVLIACETEQQALKLMKRYGREIPILLYRIIFPAKLLNMLRQ